MNRYLDNMEQCEVCGKWLSCGKKELVICPSCDKYYGGMTKMIAKLSVGITIRLDINEDLDLKRIKNKIRDHVKENKFQINTVVLKASFTDEAKDVSRDGEE